ncbi:MAG: hypothetical protein WEC83_01290 [Patescibacteria group bacterium]
MAKGESKATNTEVHLFILWENARQIEEQIIADISKKFKVLKAYEVCWSQEKFSENLSRFYGTKLPTNSRKEAHVGTEPFLAVVVEDRQPIYKVHTTTKGDMAVNTNLFTSKTLHREWTGGGHRIHATNTAEEADHDLMLLFGKTGADFLSEFNQSQSPLVERWEKDLVGSDGWANLSELFKVLNATVRYVVLRNFELMPDKFYFGKHGDIDLLVENYKDAQLIINSRPVFSHKYRVHHEVRIGQDNVRLDLRFVGDSYYDERWEKAILAGRQLRQGAFYIPAERDYFFSLLYHALIHKTEISSDYINRLSAIAQTANLKMVVGSFRVDGARALADFLLETGYAYTQPYDKSVYFNQANAAVGINRGARRLRSGTTPLRNYLKQAKVPLKHYAAKAKRIAQRRLNKLFNR